MPPRFAPGALQRFRTLRAAPQTLARLPSSAPLQVRTPPPASAQGAITKKLPSLEAQNSNWRRRRDSNPRDLIQAKRFSRPPHSTTLPPLRVG